MQDAMPVTWATANVNGSSSSCEARAGAMFLMVVEDAHPVIDGTAGCDVLLCSSEP
ncbi:hypothetical protein [Streptomyces sp. NPDC001828]|uniref:hypothetical protein n=1 Tax=Streptomyces sp. NPDC001828 TaxID=3364615 RepID=UPI0036AAFBEE